MACTSSGKYDACIFLMDIACLSIGPPWLGRGVAAQGAGFESSTSWNHMNFTSIRTKRGHMRTFGVRCCVLVISLNIITLDSILIMDYLLLLGTCSGSSHGVINWMPTTSFNRESYMSTRVNPVRWSLLVTRLFAIWYFRCGLLERYSMRDGLWCRIKDERTMLRLWIFILKGRRVKIKTYEMSFSKIRLIN